MALTINAPDVESRLQAEAARRLTTEEYARQLLEKHLTAQIDNELEAQSAEVGKASNETEKPFYATATIEEWLAAFDAWINSHPPRTPLPEDAFERASFYEGRP